MGQIRRCDRRAPGESFLKSKKKMFSQNTPPERLTNEGTTKRIAFSLRPFPDGRRTRTDKREKENRVERK